MQTALHICAKVGNMWAVYVCRGKKQNRKRQKKNKTSRADKRHGTIQKQRLKNLCVRGEDLLLGDQSQPYQTLEHKTRQRKRHMITDPSQVPVRIGRACDCLRRLEA